MKEAPALAGLDAFDQLATMVAVVSPDGRCLLANSTLENVLGVSRQALQRRSVLDWLLDPQPLRDTLLAVARNEVASGRFDAAMRRAAPGAGTGELPIHVIVSQMDRPDHVLVEMIEVERRRSVAEPLFIRDGFECPLGSEERD